jgi:predicted amidophosphoribosyltransferase
MKLIKCKQCGAEISRSATICPKCGGKSPAKALQEFGCLLFGVGIFIIVLIIVLATIL